MVMTHQTPARGPDTMTLQDHIAAIGNNLYQLDDMSQADICDLADQLADLLDLVAGVADGRDEAVDAVLRMVKRQDRLMRRIDDYILQSSLRH
jgi:hypothetical protein